MALSDVKVRAAKPAAKDYKLADEKSLFLLVKKNGSKYWRMKYRVDGKEKLLAIGVYPDVSLAQARQSRDNARTLLSQGVDPAQHRKTAKEARQASIANSFEVIAREWLEKRGKKSKAGDYRLKRLLEKDLFPYIGNQPIADITPPELLQVLRKIEARGAIETAHRAKQCASQVFRYAVAIGCAERDPGADLRGALITPTKRHFSSITNCSGILNLATKLEVILSSSLAKVAT